MRFSYIKYDQKSINLQQELKNQFEKMEAYINSFLPNSRPKTLMMTSLEEAYMWAGKAIRDAQIERTKSSAESEERGEM